MGGSHPRSDFRKKTKVVIDRSRQRHPSSTILPPIRQSKGTPMSLQPLSLRYVLFTVASALGVAAGASQGCSSNGTDQPLGTGGASAEGGSAGVATGGSVPGTGGTTTGSGGTSNNTGGVQGTGGAAGSGGSTGGAAGSGGVPDGGRRDSGPDARASVESGAAGAGGAGPAPDGSVSCTTPPPQGTPIGWATVDGMGFTGGVTGGGNAAPMTVTTAAQF